jgi:hypothetical protein
MSQPAPIADPQLRRVGMPGLKAKNVLVTGGSSGIGQAIAVRFAEHGANVAINYLTTPDEAAATEEQVHACVRQVRQQGVRDVLVQGDISYEEDVVRMVGEATERLGVSTSWSTTPAFRSRDRPGSFRVRTSTRSSRSTFAGRFCVPGKQSSVSSRQPPQAWY